MHTQDPLRSVGLSGASLAFARKEHGEEFDTKCLELTERRDVFIVSSYLIGINPKMVLGKQTHSGQDFLWELS